MTRENRFRGAVILMRLISLVEPWNKYTFSGFAKREPAQSEKRAM